MGPLLAAVALFVTFYLAFYCSALGVAVMIGGTRYVYRVTRFWITAPLAALVRGCGRLLARLLGGLPRILLHYLIDPLLRAIEAALRRLALRRGR